ncbi:unnamed protein product [Amoebophrya sp. A120]|nr:unnamed protein product [Amoebophrya sp. A120]|eukprot:GSA120T00022498001.1
MSEGKAARFSAWCFPCYKNFSASGKKPTGARLSRFAPTQAGAGDAAPKPSAELSIGTRH